MSFNLEHVRTLLNIHTKNSEILQQQKASASGTFAVSVQNHIDENKLSIVGLREELKRYKQKLLEQQARSGINTDPSILMELEDVDKLIDEYSNQQQTKREQNIDVDKLLSLVSDLLSSFSYHGHSDECLSCLEIFPEHLSDCCIYKLEEFMKDIEV